MNETTLPTILKQLGYATHAVGKWHQGFYKWAYTPTFRGFDTFYGFYNGGQDYYSHIIGGGYFAFRSLLFPRYDFRRDNGPFCGEDCSIIDYNASGTSSSTSSFLGQYSTTLFSQEAVNVIKNHDVYASLLLLTF